LRVAIYIDGCFWHGCPVHGTTPKTNASYWVPKLRRNVERDRHVEALLLEAGWIVLRFWEHIPPDDIADSIDLVLKARIIESDRS
jgi:DNA mismatch endonuclease (patch repair protein)